MQDYLHLSYNTYVVLFGSGVLGFTCGIIGACMYLKGRPLVGDVIAHSALPGIVIAFWLTGSKDLPILLNGALVAGLLGMSALTLFRRYLRIYEDSAMSLILAVMFGIGITLSRYVQNVVSDSSKAGLDNYIFGKAAGMLYQDTLLITVLSSICLITILVTIQKYKLIIFDSSFSRSIGWRVDFFDYLLMALLSIVIVVGLPMVGIVLVAAIVIIPPSAACFWTNNFYRFTFLSGVIGLVSCLIGSYISSIYAKTPTGPTIILVGGGIFIASSLFAPRYGLLYKQIQYYKARISWFTLLVLKEIEGNKMNASQLRCKILEISSNKVQNKIVTQYMMLKKLIQINNNNQYEITDLGKKYLEQMYTSQGGK